MRYQQISDLVLDETKDIVYIADPVTYELHYLNRAAQELLGWPKDWYGKPCYQVLQNKTCPCDFCTNNLLTHEKFHVWTHYNEMLNRYFTLKDKLVHIEGKTLRLELATDTTESVLAHLQLQRRFKENETLLACIQTLNENENLPKAICRLLEIIGNYHQAERSYIFEIDQEHSSLHNTYEWPRDCVPGRCSNLSSLPLPIVDRWIKQLEMDGEIYIPSLAQGLDPASLEFELLSARGVKSLMVAPLKLEGKIAGFLGVDNPRAEAESMTLLSSVSSFIVNDLSKRKLMDRLTYQSYTDGLTGLGNRRSYTQTLSRLEETPPSNLGIVYLDINGLKTVNDTYGHRYGDHLIQHTARALQDIFGQNLFRIGGDEFVVLCPDISREHFEAKVEKVRLLALADSELQVSLGADWQQGELSLSHQLSRADGLMYLDKQKYYSQHLEGLQNDRSGLSQELLREIQEGRFLVYLQPKIQLKTGKLAGAEALVRYKSKSGRIELPGPLILRFEAEGIIRHVDFFVMETVCRTLQEWHRAGLQEIKISVNLSRTTMMEHGIADKLTEICEQYQILPSEINLEITESIGDMKIQELRELLHRLHQKGFPISLDDFGAKYSNLALLASLEFNEVKLDQSLIKNLEENTKSQLITSHAIQMLKELNLPVAVAEGVETLTQKELLESLGCTAGQGFFFDEALPIEVFAAKYLKKKSS